MKRPNSFFLLFFLLLFVACVKDDLQELNPSQLAGKPTDWNEVTGDDVTAETTVGARSGTEAVAKFKTYLYRDDQVHADRLPGFGATEWGLIADDAAKPLKIFTDVTGIPASLKESYEYSYASSDGKCTIRIKGSATASEDALYAVMEVDIPECPEITRINTGTPDYKIAK